MAQRGRQHGKWLQRLVLELWLWHELNYVNIGASQVAQWYRICLQCRRHGFSPWIRKISWRRKWQPVPVFLPGESHRQRSLVGCSPWGCKELGMAEWLSMHTCGYWTSYLIKMGLSVFVYKMEIIISHRWSWGLVSAQEVAALRTWEIQMPFTGNPLLLPYTDEKPWSAVRTGYHILRSSAFSSLEPLGNWPTYSHSTLDLQSSVTDVW